MLDGGAGDDRLEGSSGTDVYVYTAGDGNDVVSEYTNHCRAPGAASNSAPGSIRTTSSSRSAPAPATWC